MKIPAILEIPEVCALVPDNKRELGKFPVSVSPGGNFGSYTRPQD
jgi:hypothetical protein